MHNYLKSVGIENNDFFLALYDTDLIGVNPRDPSLPNYIKAKIMRECQINYFYFLRECVVIPDQGGSVGSGRRYQLHRGNLAMNFLFVLNFNMFVELPRQHGKTTAALCRYLWVYNFGTTNSEIMFIHKDHSGSKSNLRNLKSIRDALPSYLQMNTTINSEGKKLKVPNTAVMIQHPYNLNKITTFASARNKDSANNLGRGATQPLQYYDEFGWMPFNREVYLAATPAFSTASQNAKRNMAPYGILLTTTPGDLLTDSGIYAYNIRNNATPWNDAYYDKTYQELMAIKEANKLNNFWMISYSYIQLGSGMEYFNRMVVEMGRDWPAIRREVLLEWAEIADDCPFSKEDLDIIKTFCKEPLRTVFFGQFGQYQMNIYEEMDTTYPPIIGVDVSGASYNDSSAITIIDSKETRTKATLNCNYIPTDDLAQVIYEIVSKWLPNAIINIESNGGFGSSVIQRLLKTSVKKNLYWEIKDKVLEEQYDGLQMQKVHRKVKVYGTNSTKEIRARLIEILQERVRYHKDKFIAPILHKEMGSMVVKKSGKVEHSDNSHDDQVFSYLMALYVWYDGKDLAERFHIIKNVLRTDDNSVLEEANFEESIEGMETLDINHFEEGYSDLVSQQEDFFANQSKTITAMELKTQTILEEMEMRDRLLSRNKAAREAYSRQTGFDQDMYYNPDFNTYVNLPESAFDMDQRDDEEDQYSVLQGNLADYWRGI